MPSAMSASNLRVRYDKASDVLYVSKLPGVQAKSREEQPGLVWRYDVEHGNLIGVTIIDFSTYWRKRRPELVKQIAARFVMSTEAARDVLDRAVSMS